MMRARRYRETDDADTDPDAEGKTFTTTTTVSMTTMKSCRSGFPTRDMARKAGVEIGVGIGVGVGIGIECFFACRFERNRPYKGLPQIDYGFFSVGADRICDIRIVRAKRYRETDDADTDPDAEGKTFTTTTTVSMTTMKSCRSGFHTRDMARKAGVEIGVGIGVGVGIGIECCFACRFERNRPYKGLPQVDYGFFSVGADRIRDIRSANS
jgi:hypothetical protein